MKATLCDRDKAPITGKPAALTVMLVDGDGTILFGTKEPVDVCDDCRDTLLSTFRSRVVLKDSNLAAFTGVEGHDHVAKAADKPGPAKAPASPAPPK